MKNIEVTYDALICENGTYEQGEAACLGLIRPTDDGPGRAETGPARRGGRKEK